MCEQVALILSKAEAEQMVTTFRLIRDALESGECPQLLRDHSGLNPEVSAKILQLLDHYPAENQ